MLTRAIAIVALLFPLSAIAQSDDQFLETFRRDFPKGCAETAPQSGVYGNDAIQLCRCTADGMIDAFDIAELKQITQQAVVTSIQQQRIAAIGSNCMRINKIIRHAPSSAPIQDRPSGAYKAGQMVGRLLVILLAVYAVWWNIRRYRAPKDDAARDSAGR